MKASQTLVLSVLIAGCSMPAFAQTAASSPTTAAETAPNLRAQVRTMERVFSSAIQNGVDSIAQKINDVMPGLRIFAGLPHAHGYQVENFGWFFDVEVPEVQTASVDLYQALQPDPRQNDPRRPAGNTVRPAITNREDAVPAVIQNPAREYQLAIRDSLMDAMLDYGQLPLKPTEELTVGARGADAPMPSMESTDAVTLILRITGADLALYKQGKISRAEAKARIKIKEDRR
ncbi:MAG: hypothetical protein WCQ64_09350 [Acidobacteriota bacterium]